MAAWPHSGRIQPAIVAAEFIVGAVLWLTAACNASATVVGSLGADYQESTPNAAWSYLLSDAAHGGLDVPLFWNSVGNAGNNGYGGYGDNNTPCVLGTVTDTNPFEIFAGDYAYNQPVLGTDLLLQPGNTTNDDYVIARYTVSADEVTSNGPYAIIEGSYRNVVPGGDGVQVFVYHNDAELFSATGGSVLEESNGTFRAGAEVAGGDTIDFVVFGRANNTGDETAVRGTISLNQTLPLVINMPPQSTDVVLGNPLDLNVSAFGTPPLSYQWRKDGAAISGATTNTFSIGAVATTNAGNYDVVVSDQSGSITSAVAVVTVDSPPVGGTTNVTADRNLALILNTTNLLHLASDPDGDPLTILSVDNSSTNGGRVERIISYVGDDIIYYPPRNYAGPDSFNCTVNDGRGGTAPVTVAVSVATNDTYHVVGDLAYDYQEGTPYATWSYLQSDAAHGGTEAALNWGTTGTTGNYGYGGTETSAHYPIVVGTVTNGNSFEINSGNGFYDQATVGQDVLLFPGGTTSDQYIIARYTVNSGDVAAYGPYATIQGSFRNLVPDTTSLTADSVQVYLYHNDANIFSAAGATGGSGVDKILTESNGTFSVTTKVAGGDTIDFVVDARANRSGDESAARGTIWLSQVVPTLTINTDPQSTDVVLGNPLDLSVSAVGDAPLNYQWRKGGAPIGGATAAAFSIGSVTTNDAGNYDVVVGDASGLVVTSAVAVVTVDTPPVGGMTNITTQMNRPVVFNAANLGSDADGDPLSLVSADSVSSNGAAISVAGDKIAYVPVRNFLGQDSFNCTIGDGRGGTAPVTVMVTVATNSGPGHVVADLAYDYQEFTPYAGWSYFYSDATTGGAEVPLAWGAAGNAGNNGYGGGGSYNRPCVIGSAVAPNPYQIINGEFAHSQALVGVDLLFYPGNTTSDDYVLARYTISSNDVATYGPYAAIEGSFRRMNPSGDGVQVFVFHNGTKLFTASGGPVLLESDGTFHLGAKVAGGDTIDFVVFAGPTFNHDETAAQGTISLSQTLPAVINTQPQSADVLLGNPLNLSVGAVGSSSLSYQWRKGGAPIGGADSDTLFFGAVTTSDAGDYDVVVTDQYGAITSAVAVVTVDTPPVGGTTNVTAEVNRPLVLNAADLDGLASDVDGDPLAITSVHATSAGGGRVTFNGNAVAYLPVRNYLGSDSFNCTVSDGRGGTAPVTVAVTVTTNGTRHVVADLGYDYQEITPYSRWSYFQSDAPNGGTETPLTWGTAGTAGNYGYAGSESGAHYPMFVGSVTNGNAFEVNSGNFGYNQGLLGVDLCFGTGSQTSDNDLIARYTVSSNDVATYGPYATIEGSFRNLVPSGNSVQVYVYQNAAELFSATGTSHVLNESDGRYSVTTTVAGGDTIDFVIDALGNHGGDEGAARGTIFLNSTPSVLAPPAISTAPSILPSGHFYVGYSGSADQTYRVDRATNVSGPWQIGFTNIVAGSSGEFHLDEPVDLQKPAQFYRVVAP